MKIRGGRASINLIRNAALLGLLITLTTVFALKAEAFWDRQNILDNCRYWLPLAALSVTMTLIIISGGIDLSVGSLTALAGVCMGFLWKEAKFPLPAAALACAAVGLLGGLINALLIVKGSISPLIVTLATLAAYRGLTTGISRGYVVREFPDTFGWIGRGNLLGVPTQIWLIVLIFVVGYVTLHLTWLGKVCYAMGVNERAARFAFMPVDGVKWVLYGASGLLAGLVAIVDVAHFDAAGPDRGNLLELEVVTAVVLGGTRIMGGEGSVIGTALAVLLISILKYGAFMMEIPDHYLIGIIGAMLVITAIINEWLSRLSSEKIL